MFLYSLCHFTFVEESLIISSKRKQRKMKKIEDLNLDELTVEEQKETTGGLPLLVMGAGIVAWGLGFKLFS